MNSMFQFSYYRRIQLSFLSLILLPIVIVSVFLLSMTRDAVMEKIRLTNQSVVDVMAKDITKTIDDLTYASNFFIQDPSARAQLRSFTDTRQIASFADYQRQQHIQDFFGLVLAKTLNTDIRMFLVNGQGFIIPSSEPDQLAPFRQHWEQLQSQVDLDTPKRLQWLSRVQTEGGKGEPVYYAARVIRDPADNAYLATLYIGITNPYFEKLFRQAASGTFALYDEEGRLIAGDASVLFGGGGASDQTLRSEAVLSKTGWKMIYETSDQEVTGQIYKIFYIAMLFVVPFFALFFIVSLLLAKRLHRPIQKLDFMAKQFSQGNRLIRFQGKGKDEIAQLGQTWNRMLDEIEQLITNIEQEQEQKRVIELQALFAQIRPHFLINTLNSIKCSLILGGDRLHSRQIDSLMSLLRAYMKVNEPTSLAAECKLLEHYMDIMRLRSELHVELRVTLAPEAAEFEVPKLLLQPIVENALLHGFAEKLDDARIDIEAERLGSRLEIRVTDNGEGIPDAEREALNRMLEGPETDKPQTYRRVGLINVLQRLRLTYGPDATMKLQANPPGGLTVILNMRA
ncbi:histidine kinase [Paenibacillus ehimensis]|uniref:sensor histidine kinase n=1 Tax=Paenibacillus ehimensis TaxID=79264 RepID=UPI002DBFAD21|nr:histidine kinase [Paenibacillus ehimensis]MEC0208680.1 histidine kinase [Paenibacillus ehimensis]